jgi:hypothetical protein
VKETVPVAQAAIALEAVLPVRVECPRFGGHLSAGSVGAWPEDVHRGWEQ